MTTETDTTNSSGLATSSTFTANATAGAYTVTATTSGATAPANATSVGGNYVVGAQDEINAIGSGWYCTQCEFDFITQGTFTGGVLTATGD